MTFTLEDWIKTKIPEGYNLVFSMPNKEPPAQTMREIISRTEEGVKFYQKAEEELTNNEGKEVFALGFGRGYSSEGLSGRLSALNHLTSGTYFSVGDSQVELFGLVALAVKP